MAHTQGIARQACALRCAVCTATVAAIQRTDLVPAAGQVTKRAEFFFLGLPHGGTRCWYTNRPSDPHSKQRFRLASIRNVLRNVICRRALSRRKIPTPNSMPRLRRHTMVEMLELARPLIQEPGSVTVDQFRKRLGGGTLSEVSGALRAAKMEVGLLPWSPDTIPVSLREQMMRSKSAEPADRSALLADRVVDALAPVAPLLASTREALQHALELVQDAACAQIAEAHAEAQRQSLDAWRTSQELSDAARVVEQERDDGRLQLLDAELRTTVQRETLGAERDALRRELEQEVDRVLTTQRALEEARLEVTRLLSSVSALTNAVANATAQLHAAAQRAAVAEARLEHVPALERQLAETTAALGSTREMAAHHVAESAGLREALSVVAQETSYLRDAVERAQRAATHAAKAAGAQERELELRRATDLDAGES